jgi:hypothetical protein
MEDRGAYDQLRQAGWTRWQISQLEGLRRQYLVERDQRESMAEYRRLQFLRWLIMTGKVTEQVA